MRRSRALPVALAIVALAACGRIGGAGCGPAGGGGGETGAAAGRAAPGAPAAGEAHRPAAEGAVAEKGATAGDPLLAWADANPDEGSAPLAVACKAIVEGGRGPFTFLWRFGDGSPDSTERDPRHTYAAAGEYRVELTVSSPAGETDRDATIVVVK